MGVLAVVDRVVGALLNPQLGIEFDHLVVGALHQREPHRVDTEHVQQLVEHQHRAAPLGDLHQLAVLADLHELVDLGVDPVGVVAERAGRGLEPADVAVMVGAEHVHGDVEAPLELVDDVGDVAGDVGGDCRPSAPAPGRDRPRSRSSAATARPRAVRCARPPSSLAMARSTEPSSYSDRSRNHESKVARNRSSVGLDLGDHDLHTALAPVVGGRVGVELEPVGDLLDVVALVAVLGRLLARARAFSDAPNRSIWRPASLK